MAGIRKILPVKGAKSAGYGLIKGVNDLETWCSENGERGLRLKTEFSDKNEKSMRDTYAKWQKKIWWKCSICNYEWETMVLARTFNGYDCPACANKVVLYGKNDLETWCDNHGERGVKLKAEFSSNNTFSIREVVYGSHRKALWVCRDCGNEWSAVVRNRTTGEKDCPVCAGKVVVAGYNDLLSWCKDAGEYGERLIQEYSLENELKITEVTPRSNRRIKWVCSICGYTWNAILISRVSMNTGCPACSGKIAVQGKNDLLTWCKEHGVYGEKLIREYSAENEQGLECLAAHADRRVTWICEYCGGKWQIHVGARTGVNQHGCPYCNKTSTSYGEQIVYYLLQREFPDNTVLNRDRSMGDEIDVFIPELNFGIEYSGHTWHKDSIEKDRIKKEKLLKQGITIYTIMEYESTSTKRIPSDFEITIKKSEDYKKIPEIVKKIVYEHMGKSINASLSEEELAECKNASLRNIEVIIELVMLGTYLGLKRNVIGNLFGKTSSYYTSTVRRLPKETFETLVENIRVVNDTLESGGKTEGLSDEQLKLVPTIVKLRKKYEEYIFDIDEVLFLLEIGYNFTKIGKELGYGVDILNNKLNDLSEEERSEKASNIVGIINISRFGDTAEQIATEFELDLDFVKKIQAFIKKYSVI